MTEFVPFELNKKHTFTIDGKPTRLEAGDIIGLHELEVPKSRFRFIPWPKNPATAILFFIRGNFTLRIDGAAAIKFEVGKYKFRWLAEFLAAVNDMNLEPEKTDDPKLISFKFV
ncbi:MAG TPA: hypothetical protein VJB92_02735 [Candidatus Paceibacterota bacterium]